MPDLRRQEMGIARIQLPLGQNVRGNKMRRLLIGVVLAILALAGMAGTSAAANASSCDISHPNIGLHADPQYQGYTVSCPGAQSADWEIVAADNYDHGGIDFPDINSTDYYADSFDVGGHLGLYYLKPDGAYDGNFNDIAQATESFWIKLDSHSYAHGWRSGNWVYLWAYATRFNSGANFGAGAFTASTGRKVDFQQFYSGAWHNAGYKYTGSNGDTAALKVWAPTKRNFRVYVEPTGTRWGAWSGTIYR
jgi:hypothetical protein